VDITYLYDGDVAAHSSSRQMYRTTSYTYDTEANPVTTTVRTELYDHTCGAAGTCPYHQKTITNTYANDEVKHYGKPTRTVTASESNVTSDDGITHTTEFSYLHSSTGFSGNRYFQNDRITDALFLRSARVEPGSGESLDMQTVYTPDEFGNIVTTTECPGSVTNCLINLGSTPNRVTKVNYDPTQYAPAPGGHVTQLAYDKGRFPVWTENAEGHREYTAYHPTFGTLVEKTGPNGIHTCFEYDALGRQAKQIERCGTPNAELTTITDRFLPTGWDLPQARSVVRTRTPDGVASWAYADAFGRSIGGRGRTFDGGFSEAPSTTYDRWARTSQVSAVRTLGSADPVFLTTTTFDEANRVTSIVRDLGSIDGSTVNRRSIQSFNYFGTSVQTMQNIDGEDGANLFAQQRTETKNVIGKVQLVQALVDGTQTNISYIYDAEGNLTDTFDGPNHTHLDYDVRGRRRIVQDPDMGEWDYTYDIYGNLVSQKDANQKTVSMTYDKIGRILSRRDDATGNETKWAYDRAPGAGIGKVAAMVSEPDDKFRGTCDASYDLPSGEKRAVRSFTYNNFGDVEDTYDCVDGETFATNHGYDTLGRPSVVTYPRVDNDRFAVQYNYSSLGFLHYVSDAIDTSSIYWAVKSRDAAGQVTSEVTRNGVETTTNRNLATGWMMAAQSVAHADGDTIIQRWSNQFDEVGNLRRRLRTDQVNGDTSEEIFGYDKLNRLRSATVNVGSDQYNEGYEIDLRGNLTTKAGKGYTYGAAGGCQTGGPHAVCTFDGGSPFQYDANGNMLSGNNREITYNLANKVAHIQSGANGVDFLYDADGNRAVQETSDGGTIARTVYVGLGETGKSIYERTTKDGVAEHTHFLYAPGVHNGNAFALKVVRQGAPTLSFNHFDHLGSVTAMSDDRGHVVSATQPGGTPTVAGYDPWGARRSPDGRPADPASFQLLPGHREFTSHETIPGVGLVNMNGRVYDPELGRFLSPDPNVQFVADLQSYNRYSYVLNNPLRYTDPTGYYGSTGGQFNPAQFAFGVLLGVVVSGACGYAAAACAAAYIVMISYTATTMYMAGASANQIIGAAAIGIAAGFVGGAVGGAITEGLGGGVGAAMVGGAFSQITSTAITTAVMGGNLSAGDFFLGVVTAAVTSGVIAGMNSNLVSKAYAAEAQGGAATGAEAEEVGEFRGAIESDRGGGRTNIVLAENDDPDAGVYDIPPPMGGSRDCEDLLNKIQDRRNLLAKRAQELREDKKNLPLKGKMSIEGHQHQFEGWQTNLRDLLDEWNTRGCGGGLPADAWEYATMPAPSPAPKTESNTVRNGILAGAGAYAVYRVLRMVPSIVIPPFWPSIPANALAP
ncbi:MAG TPA: RHS repeat-associated core domain-containing protein, partial [Polyangia bacterium]|nr:RHS repeat-associated core domain-containing protein [Polyangia bacterium]